MKFTAEETHKILVSYVLEAGESINEELNTVFEGQKVFDYWDFLLKKDLLTSQQHALCSKMYEIAYNRKLNSFDLMDVENIETLTCTSNYDMLWYCQLQYEKTHGKLNVNSNQLEEEGLILTPLVCHAESVSDYNEFYWNEVLKLIAEYLVTDDDYEEIIDDWNSTVKYYLGEEA